MFDYGSHKSMALKNRLNKYSIINVRYSIYNIQEPTSTEVYLRKEKPTQTKTRRNGLYVSVMIPLLFDWDKIKK